MYLILIIISLLIILLFQLRIKIKSKFLSDKFLNNKNTICIYMYTFGKNHTKYNFKTVLNKKFLNIDFYIYTDNLEKVYFLNNYRNNFKSINIIKVPLLDKLDFIDENRLTAKYYKFKIIPNEIKKYDYMFHIDFGRINLLNHINEKHILALIESNKNKKLFLCEGAWWSLNDDFKQQINFKYENEDKINKFKSKIDLKKILSKKHVQTSHFIRNIKDSETNFIFEKIYDELIINKLKRDQFVFNYTLLKYNYDYNKIKYVYSFIFLYIFGILI